MKLHEVLAITGDREKQVRALMDEGKHTFKNRTDLFVEVNKSLQMFDENAVVDAPDEHIAMTGTVPEKLHYLGENIGNLYNLLLQLEDANQEATADLVVGGETLATALPATFLLNMEKRLVALQDLYLAIPTLPSGKVWEADDQKGAGVYRSTHPERTYKTKKEAKHKVLYEATKEHPAQIEKWMDTVDVGMYTKEVWCSMVPSAQKSAMLARIGKLLAAVKQARQRANTVEVKNASIGNKIFGYIHGF